MADQWRPCRDRHAGQDASLRTVEYFRIPRDILVICRGKSTYARCGVIVNVTPLEPEWEGQMTIEISNITPLPSKMRQRGVALPRM